MLSLMVVAAIVLAIGLGYKTRINIGLYAIAFAYLIGCFVMGMSPNELIKLWPLKIFFIIFSVSLFYSFATINGTLERLAEHLLYRCRNVPHLLPFAIFFIATLIAGLGAGYYTVLAFMAPLTLLICQRTGMSMVVGAMSVNYGALAGANFVASQSGIIFRGLMTHAGLSDDQAFLNSAGIFASTFIIPILVIAVMVFTGKQRKTISQSVLDVDTPRPFDAVQKKTLWLTVIMMLVVLVFPIAHLVAPHNAAVTFLNSKINIGLIASIFSVIALVMKLGDERKAIASLPWPTIIMICGVGMLISVAIHAGAIKALGSWIGTSIPVYLVPIVFGIVGAFMSLFASTLGVVTPALFPLVPGIAQSLHIDPMIIFISIVVGAQATSISPFSSGGSLVLAACSSEEKRQALFPQMLFKAAPIGFAAALLFNVALTFLF
ncbi:SLC13 family permease [Gallaecimonas mangrovi]|uniref:SLC13 family permease n=1 Tax=Gallaecimonas mangrovi TaxID=2291597 RepID=UPI000E2087B1|nr:SLC13 family permease [Gallaecimonas mangrovi]